MANKKKNKYGNPQKNIDALKEAEAAKLARQVDKALVEQRTPTDSKPMFMRIIVLAIVAVMILGVVIGAVVSA
ncbi:hypothetical protein [Ruminococcus sp.]|jgi:hypothetical protein|uniref:hypothetical protein n=1 Tax=Ruminococcus sp. TaxID=41978 RepID=UPI001B1913E2|nr:hypothetical protein [Ruminococcus sp.]MBO5557220.1 hypothetical protein [Ruminococcus sp.]MBQ9540951.1 hypothetical protein [Ruminococcus sp.]